VSEFRYQARRLRYPGGTLWGVFREPAGVIPCMMASFTGRLAWWQARRHAAAMNRRLP
jgi:hypothetical protein